jgi:hypothetical protein
MPHPTTSVQDSPELSVTYREAAKRTGQAAAVVGMFQKNRPAWTPHMVQLWGSLIASSAKG